MNSTQHMEHEILKQLCYFYWDIFNSAELIALSPSTTHPNAIQYSSFVLSIITCIIGLPANIIVILVTGFLMKKNKSKIWFLNLALADLAILLFLPLYAVSVIKGRWPFGYIMCKTYNFLTFVNMYASIYILTALNITRTLSVAKPIWHLKFISSRFCWCVCVVIWVSSAVCSIPAIVYGDFDNNSDRQCLPFYEDVTNIIYLNHDQNSNNSQIWKSFPRDLCDEPFENTELSQQWISGLSTTMSFIVPQAVIAFGIPLCVILFSNIIIVFHVQNSQRKPSSRLYKVVTAAVLAFFCTRTPLILAHIIFLVVAYNQRFTLMYKILISLPLLSSIAVIDAFLNPVVYVLVGKQIRRNISEVFDQECYCLSLRRTPKKCVETPSGLVDLGGKDIVSPQGEQLEGV